ncbi:MAG: DUF4105 domain-containing protein [Oligoflexales bacterium]
MLKLKTVENKGWLPSSCFTRIVLCRLVLAALTATCFFAREGLAQEKLYEPADFDQVDFYLHTIDVGDLVYNNFGHTALRVHDRVQGSDIIFNWGLFDFGEPLSFSFRFFKGLLKYKLGVYPHRVALQVYRAEERTVWEDKILLSREQKKILWERLRWNIRPENVYYNYQYFFDNCSTRPRDYFDEALGKQLSDRFSAESSDLTFRDMVRSHYLSIPFIELSLDILMNSRIDRVMTEWERMFLPATLRNNMLRAQNESGQPVLESRGTIVWFPSPAAAPLNGFGYLGLMAIASMAPVTFSSIFRRRQSVSVANRIFGLGLFFYGFYFATIGLLMVLSWIFSEHLDLHHNANLWLFWPIDYILLGFGAKVLVTGRLAMSDRFAAFIKWYSIAHLAGYFCLFALRITGVVQQNVDRILLWGTLYFCILFLLLIRVSVQDRAKGGARVG